MEDEIFCVNVFGTYVVDDVEYYDFYDVYLTKHYNFSDIHTINNFLTAHFSTVMIERIWLSLIFDICRSGHYVHDMVEMIKVPTNDPYNNIIAELIHGIITRQNSRSAKFIWNKYKFDPMVTKLINFLTSNGVECEFETMSLEKLMLRAITPEHLQWQIITFKPPRNILVNVWQRFFTASTTDVSKVEFASVVDKVLN